MPSRPLLLGHRGASKYAPENTIAAFDLALKHGCDGFEFDVRYTLDARSVVCHDPRSRRRTIEKCQFDSLDLPSADQVIKRFAPLAFLDIELKVLGEVDPVLDAVVASRSKRLVVSSFVPEVLEDAHRRQAKLPLGLICENERQLRPWRKLPLRAVMVHYRLAGAPLINELHASGLKIFVWTVNKQSEMRRFAELGVDGLISDDTQLLAKTFHQQ